MRHLLLLSFDLRNKSQYFYQQKWVYSKKQRIAIAIQAELVMAKAIGKFNKQRRGSLFYREKGRS